MLITDWYWSRIGLKDQIRSRLTLYVPIVFGGVLAAIKIIHSLRNGTSAGMSIGVTPYQYALTQCRVILTYLRLFLFPIDQSGDWEMPFYRSLTDHGAWLYVSCMLVLLGGIVLSYRRARLFSFGLAVFLVILAPTSSVVPINDALAERRMYVPIIGLILASVAVAERLSRNSAILRIGATACLIFAAFLTYQRSRVWGNDIVFWKDVIQQNPSNACAHLGLGSSYMLHRRFADAIKEYDAIDRLSGPSEKIILARILAYQYSNNSDLALDGLHKVAAMHPTAFTYGQIGHIEAVLGHNQESLAAFNSALTLDPKYAPAYAERGMVYISIGDNDRAQADFQNALAIDPNNGNARSGLSKLGETH